MRSSCWTQLSVTCKWVWLKHNHRGLKVASSGRVQRIWPFMRVNLNHISSPRPVTSTTTKPRSGSPSAQLPSTSNLLTMCSTTRKSTVPLYCSQKLAPNWWSESRMNWLASVTNKSWIKIPDANTWSKMDAQMSSNCFISASHVKTLILVASFTASMITLSSTEAK